MHLLLAIEVNEMLIQRTKRNSAIVAVLLALAVFAGYAPSASSGGLPATPQIPRDFQWSGRYLVPDLGEDVTFSWQGNGGNLQMTAGGPADEVYFTNLIFNGKLYTLTYNWPYDKKPPLGSDKCVCLGRLTLSTLNACLNTSRFVGAETLDDQGPANHFRVSVVFGETASKPNPFRVPIMEGDFYLDPSNPSKILKVLHYGFQNLLDPALDEWMVLQDFEFTPGTVTLPSRCNPKSCPKKDVFGLGFYCQ